MLNFCPMLATPLPSTIPEGTYLVSAKLDGIRCLYHRGELFTRSLKSIPNRYVNRVICAVLSSFESEEDLILDGELVVGSETDPMAYRNTMSSVMSEDLRDFKINYVIFDLYKISEPKMSSRDRLFHLDSLLPNKVIEEENVSVKLLPQVFIHEHEVQEAAKIYLDRGYEGLMIKPSSSPYKCGRATPKSMELMKFKTFVDAEAIVVGVVQKTTNQNEATKNELGNTKRSTHKEGMVLVDELGALEVAYKGNRFSIGSGFTGEERVKFWLQRDKVIGKMVKFKYTDYGAYDVPRFPVFLGFRSKLDL